jgi:hypothetical protein
MRWSEVRITYPDQWLVVEALQAHTTSNQRRKLDQLAVIEACPDGSTAMQRYRQYHQQFPAREFYFVHTSRQELDIQVRNRLIRAVNHFSRLITCT